MSSWFERFRRGALVRLLRLSMARRSALDRRMARQFLLLRKESFTRGNRRRGVQVMRRGIRPRTVRKIAWQGHAEGRCSRIWVFISTTRAAILTSRRRSVSNCATLQAERFGMAARNAQSSQ